MAEAVLRTTPAAGSATGRLLALSRHGRRPLVGLLAVGPLAAAWLLLFTWWAVLMLAGVTAWLTSSTAARLCALVTSRRPSSPSWPVPRGLFLVG